MPTVLRTGLPLVGAAAALRQTAPRPDELLTSWSAGTAAGDPTATLVGAAALAAWALLAWLVVVSALLAAGALPGAVGGGAARLARLAAPGAVRRGLQLALGIGLVTSVLDSPAAAADGREGRLRAVTSPGPHGSAVLAGPSPVVAEATPSLDWPAEAAPARRGSPTARPQRLSAAPLPRAVTTAPLPRAVTVRPGDSLWRIAARHLPENASVARVARTWPTWWAANRAAIGSDPDLLHPGVRLTAPRPPSAP